ncbi:XapX domain-containing protein [Rubritalea marina]|uniref:XapX domain-containing protein n=1 Tax=Rubritalea marina TaxID=361055 RepID=UPI000367DC62|nr:DUF1427 family protein [Rubritalea marina]
MSEVLLSLGVGILIGVIFTALKLPIPAPPVLAGIMGILGIYLGNKLYQWVLESFFS